MILCPSGWEWCGHSLTSKTSSCCSKKGCHDSNASSGSQSSCSSTPDDRGSSRSNQRGSQASCQTWGCSKKYHQSLKNPRQAFLCAGRVLLLLLEELFACPIKRLSETLPRPWFSAQILWLTADKWRIISKSKEDYVVIWGELCSVCSGNIDLISHFWFQSWRSDPLIIWQQKRRKHF